MPPTTQSHEVPAAAPAPTEGRLVMPGDALATSEETLPGEGTYDDGHTIRAARVGYFRIDPDELRAVVQPVTSVPVTCKVGDIVIGRVYMVKDSMAGVNVEAVVGKEARKVSGDTNGTLHVSKVADRYIEDVGREYRLGDLLRCVVIQNKPSIQLSTDFKGGGAVKAFCLRCRYGLERLPDDTLECPNCGQRDVRNIAPDYGFGVLALHPEAPERVKTPRDRDRGGRPRDGGRGGPRGGGRGGPPGRRGGPGGGGRGGPGRGGPRGGPGRGDGPGRRQDRGGDSRPPAGGGGGRKRRRRRGGGRGGEGPRNS